MQSFETVSLLLRQILKKIGRIGMSESQKGRVTQALTVLSGIGRCEGCQGGRRASSAPGSQHRSTEGQAVVHWSVFVLTALDNERGYRGETAGKRDKD